MLLCFARQLRCRVVAWAPGPCPCPWFHHAVPLALTFATQSLVTRRVSLEVALARIFLGNGNPISEAEWQYRFFLANASGYQNFQLLNRVSEDFECIPR